VPHPLARQLAVVGAGRVDAVYEPEAVLQRFVGGDFTPHYVTWPQESQAAGSQQHYGILLKRESPAGAAHLLLHAAALRRGNYVKVAGSAARPDTLHVDDDGAMQCAVVLEPYNALYHGRAVVTHRMGQAVTVSPSELTEFVATMLREDGFLSVSSCRELADRFWYHFRPSGLYYLLSNIADVVPATPVTALPL
jgi:hypothetical protein